MHPVFPGHMYMFRCLETGLDNSHQRLKEKKDMVRINDSETSIPTN